MKLNKRGWFFALMVASLLLAVVAPALAAEPKAKTLVLTEEKINQSYRITNPAYRDITNMSVDLQDGQVIVNATVTLRGKDPVAVVVTFVPVLKEGRVYWTVSAATKDGAAVSGDLLNEINTRITASWRHYFKEKSGPGRIGSLEITDSALTITYALNSKR
jgi:Cu/Ag efflux pump CusA